MTDLSSWGDLNPEVGMRFGNVEETVKNEGVAMIDYNELSIPQDVPSGQ